MDKHIWEGWTVKDFIESLEPQLDEIMSGRSCYIPFTTKAELRNWCTNNQPYYKKPIREVLDYFAGKYGIRK